MKIILSLIILIVFNSSIYAADSHVTDNKQEIGHNHDTSLNKVVSSGIKSTNIVDIDAIGMVCDFCAQSIEKVFMKREEVQGINIDLENQKVIIYLKDNSNIEDELIVKLLEDSGYGVDKINRSI